MLSIAALSALSLTAVSSLEAPSAQPVSPNTGVGDRLAEVLDRHSIATAGIGVMRDGSVAFTGTFGLQNPDTPANADTRFDIGSITKVVAAGRGRRGGPRRGYGGPLGRSRPG